MSSFSQDSVPNFYIGHHDFSRRDDAATMDTINNAHANNYDMVTAPISTEAFYSRVLHVLSGYLQAVQSQSACDLTIPVLGSLNCADKQVPETHLQPDEAVSQVIYTTSSWIDLTSSDPLISEISRQVLSLEVLYASFCGATNILTQGPRFRRASEQDGLSQYARAIHEALRLGPFLQFHILLSISQKDERDDIFNLSNYERAKYKSSDNDGDQPIGDSLESWEAWNSIRSLCSYYQRLSVALTIPSDLPPYSVISRWFSEPVRILHFPATSFLKTNRGEVALSNSHRQILFRFMRKNTLPWLLVSGVGHLPLVSGGETMSLLASSDVDPTPAQASQVNAVQPNSRAYVNHLRAIQSLQPTHDAISIFAAGYQDYLQSPLQPLADNLESMTYEVFEKDPIKYEWYERATASALSDWMTRGKSGSGRDGSIVVAVVGAGRGPLVTRALQAAQRVKAKVDVWALEKNPNAFVLLQRYFSTKWKGQVNLARSDMRSWEGPFHYSDDSNVTADNGYGSQSKKQKKIHYKVDIFISELLGSFADNELSPECLDGVMRLLNSVDGISIPSSYTVHLTPIAAPKIHADIMNKTANGQPEAAQISYVVSLHEIDFLSTTILKSKQNTNENSNSSRSLLPNIGQAWEFRHTVSGYQSIARLKKAEAGHGNEHNRRFARLEFKCRNRGVCHGLAGYFETVLYDPEANQPLSGQGSAAAVPRGKIEKPKNAVDGDSGDKFTSHKVELSTNPLTMDQKSRDMISWFPIYFPLKVPLYTPDNSLLVVSIWRQTDGRKVWYEWLVESFLLTESGRKIRLSASDLHSSVDNGCLM